MNYEWIEENGLTAKGKQELLNHLSGEKLSYKQAIQAMCYQCTGFYIGGKEPCSVKTCPLFPFMPYNPNKRTSKTMSEEHKAKITSALRKRNAV